MDAGVALRLRVYPDEGGRRHTSGLEQIELGEGSGARSGVRGDGQAGPVMRVF